MTRMLIATLALALAIPTEASVPARRGSQPMRVGACVTTQIKQVGQRLVDGPHDDPVAGSGSAVTYANGIYGVSYDEVAAVNRSRAGDRVKLCLVSLPRHCPPGDDRGRAYKATNLRTRQSWSLPDAAHQCGGA